MRMSQMSKEELKELKNQLIECGKQWVPVGEPLKSGILGNDEEKNKLWIKIFTIAMQIFEQNSYEVDSWHSVDIEEANNAALLDVLTKDVFGQFDCMKSNLYTYMNNLIQKRKIDLLRKKSGRKTSNNEKIKGIKSIVSLNMSVGNEESNEFGDMLPDEVDRYEIASAELQSIQEMEALGNSINIKVNLSGNSKKVQTLPVIYTSEVIAREHLDRHKLFLGQHTIDINKAINDGFVDQCMNDKCRGEKEIYYGTLKKYGEVVKNTENYDPNENLPLPMENKVGAVFLNVSPTTYSKAKKLFYELFKEIRGWKSKI